MLDVNSSDTILSIKQQVQSHSIIECSNQVIYFGGIKKLDDENKALADYDIIDVGNALWFEMRMISK
jgi:hypothetical protein